MTAAQRLAAFAVALRHDDVPAAVREGAVLHLLDGVGCAYAASGLGEAGEARAVVAAQGGTPDSSVIGTRVRAPATGAALANGTLMHALDFDDTHPGSICHITTVVGPAALAVAEAVGADGRELVTAYVAGCETVARLGAAADGAFHRRGFHATGVCGVFGATVAAARLLSLDEAATMRALGIRGLVRARGCSSSSATDRPRSGCMPAGPPAPASRRPCWRRPVPPARPASSTAATASSRRTSATRTAAAIAARLDDLGARWETAAMAIKAYPCCHFMHGTLEALESLGLAADDVAQIDVALSADAGVGLILEPAAETATAAAHAVRREVQPALHGRRRCSCTDASALPPSRPRGSPTRRRSRWRSRMSYRPVPLAEMANGFGGSVAVQHGRRPHARGRRRASARLGGGADAGRRRARQVPRQRRRWR